MTFARSITGESGSNIGGIAPLGTSLYDGWVPIPLTTLVLTTFQARCVAKLTSCLAWLSVYSGWFQVTSDNPYGLSGPIGSACDSVMNTVLSVPSMSMSSRATTKCWWNG